MKIDYTFKTAQKEAIKKALDASGGHIGIAIKLLGTTKQTMCRLLTLHEIDVQCYLDKYNKGMKYANSNSKRAWENFEKIQRGEPANAKGNGKNDWLLPGQLQQNRKWSSTTRG